MRAGVVAIGALVVGALVAVALLAGHAGDGVTRPGTGAPVYWKSGTAPSQVKWELRQALDEWRQVGAFPVKVTRTTTSDAEQAAYVAQGVSKAATAAQSAHGPRVDPTTGKAVSWAIDVYPAENSNTIVLDTSDPRWAVLVDFFESRGLTNGRAWLGLSDWPHMEVDGWRDAQIASGYAA